MFFHSLSEREVSAVTLAVDEGCTNIIRHCYGEKNQGVIILRLRLYRDKIVIVLKDFGGKIDLKELERCRKRSQHALEKRGQVRPGGLGVLLMHSVMDKVQYKTSPKSGPFLPRNFSLSPPDKPFEIAARNLPASMVGGDLYDCIELRKDLLGCTIGDVSGKGVPAALYMARLISDFRFYAHQYEDPVPTMQILNKMLAERSQQGMFVTMVYMTLDINRGLLRYVNGGHIPPLLYRRQSNEISRLVGGEGIPLGIRTPTAFDEEKLNLQQGDTLVLFSDGILDAKNSAGEHFNVKKLEKIIRGKWDTAENLVSEIVDSVSSHTGKVRQFDDITILVLRWR